MKLLTTLVFHHWEMKSEWERERGRASGSRSIKCSKFMCPCPYTLGNSSLAVEWKMGCRKVFHFQRVFWTKYVWWDIPLTISLSHSLTHSLAHWLVLMPPPLTHRTSTKNFYHIHIWCLGRGNIFDLHFLHTNMWILGQFVLKPIIGIHFICVRQTRVCHIYI